MELNIYKVGYRASCEKNNKTSKMSANGKGCGARALRNAEATKNKAASDEDDYGRFAGKDEF